MTVVVLMHVVAVVCCQVFVRVELKLIALLFDEDSG